MSEVHQFKRKIEPFKVIEPIAWSGKPAPPVKWLVKNAIPLETVVLLSGDSGLGKSLIAQQLQTAAATNKSWLGYDVEPCRSFGMYCEDPDKILHLRQEKICEHLEVPMDSLEDMTLASRIGLDNTLMEFNRRTDIGYATPLFEQLRAHVRDFSARLVIIDTAAHVFAGNENIRAQVTQFVNALQRLATEINGAVVLNSHPSVSSLASGSGYSGSTAWRASVRAHIFLKRPKGFDDEAEPGDGPSPNERVLKTMKSNWGPGSGLTRLAWDEGVFKLLAPQRQRVNDVVGKLELNNDVANGLRYLIGRGQKVASSPKARNGVYASLRNLPSCRAYTRADIENAVDVMLKAGRVVIVTLGPPTRRYSFIRPSDTPYFDEADGQESPPPSAPKPPQGSLL
ncbi:MAG: AAA family ATPase [Stellaceae bacterium]